jgi:hypothetical protein
MAIIQFKYKISKAGVPGFVIRWMSQEEAAKLRRKGYTVEMIEE